MLNFLFESCLLGLKNLHLHKLRSLLTALGIILGVTGVIIMWAIGEGAKEAALEQMRQLGATNIVLRSAPPPESNQASQRTQRTLEYGLKRTDFDRLKQLPHVISIVPIRNTGQKITRGDSRAGTNANCDRSTGDGSDQAAARARAIFQSGGLRSKKRRCVFWVR